MQTFFGDDDYREYIALMADSCRRYEVDVWAYCLMPNHVHFIAVPMQSDSFRHAMGEAHRRYTRHVNFREKWRGHLWQVRFASYPVNEWRGFIEEDITGEEMERFRQHERTAARSATLQPVLYSTRN